MSLNKLDAIDWLAVDPDKGLVDLAIVDDFDWLEPDVHLTSLQEKINSYIGAVEEGQVAELAAARAPNSSKFRDWQVRIVVYFQYAVPDGEPRRFLSHAKKIAKDAGVVFACKTARTGEEWGDIAL